MKNVLVQGALFLFIALMSGCSLGEGLITDRIPHGRLVPLDQVPEKVLPIDKRRSLPEGITIEHCDGDMYRFNYPDGTIWLKNANGEDCGGVI